LHILKTKNHDYRFKIAKFFLLFTVVFFFLPVNVSFSEEANPNLISNLEAPGKKPIIVDAEDVEYLDEEGMIKGAGNVKIDYQEVKLNSDKVELDIKSQQAVAYGNVHITRGMIELTGDKLVYDFNSKLGTMSVENHKKVHVFYKSIKIEAEQVDFDLNSQTARAVGQVKLFEGKAIFSGENLTYNFKDETAEFSDIRFKSFPWFGRAQSAKKTDSERIDLNRGYVTTCEKEKPHYRIQAKKIFYFIDKKIVAKNALLFVGKMPVFYFPYWKQSLESGNSNLSFAVGNKKEWGWFVLTTWRDYLNGEVAVKVHLDERELKGFAGGVDTDYETKKFGKGSVKTYHMNERDKCYTDAQETERYRAQLKHRWQVDPSTLAMLEYNKTSDIDFIKDYLYREYSFDVQPVSEASISHYGADYNVSLYAKKRTNSFYSEVERLPELAFSLNSKRIGDSRLYFREDLSLANLNQKNANSDVDTDANRIDSYNELKYPTKLPGVWDWINVAPYVGLRQTYYSKSNTGSEHDLIRGIYYYGLEMNTKFYRIYETSGNYLGIELNRLRHVITPSIKYSYIHTPTVSSGKLGSFDSIDDISSENTFTFGIENHLQTKWENRNKKNTFDNVDLVYFYPHVDYTQNAASGLRHFSFITSELNVRPYSWLHVDSDNVYDQHKRRFQSSNIDFSALNKDKWQISLGKRYDRDISEQTTADFYYKINRFWQVRTYVRYLSYEDVFQEQQYTIYRDLHCWLLEMTYDIKLDEDNSTQDRTIWVIFRLKAFPEETPVRLDVDYQTTNRI